MSEKARRKPVARDARHGALEGALAPGRLCAAARGGRSGGWGDGGIDRDARRGAIGENQAQRRRGTAPPRAARTSRKWITGIAVRHQNLPDSPIAAKIRVAA